MNLKRVVNVFLVAVPVLILLAAALPVLVCDQFRIGGESMSPTLGNGDHILVNKLLAGARIYTEYDFSDPDMECFRMPGFRKVRPGDVAVFNFPEGYDRGKIEFRINYVYAKRCIGCPGDTVSIVDGYYHNSSLPGMRIGPECMQEKLSGMRDDDLLKCGIVLPAMSSAPGLGWTIKDFGPMYVPAKGDRVAMTPEFAQLYMKEIEYETGVRPAVTDGKVYICGVPASEYEFRSDWYFFGGDNVLNSKDSRYFGLVPADYIVGIATRLIWSEDSYSGRMRWERFMRKL